MVPFNAHQIIKINLTILHKPVKKILKLIPIINIKEIIFNSINSL
jgi:hypothetical protein